MQFAKLLVTHTVVDVRLDIEGMDIVVLVSKIHIIDYLKILFLYSTILECHIDIDECNTGLHSCSSRARCVNSAGTYECICHTGYIGNGKICARK